jgi:hypothetical protein
LVFALAGRVRGGSVPWLLLRLLRVRRLMLCLLRSCLLVRRGVFFRVSVSVSVSLRLCKMPLNSSLPCPRCLRVAGVFSLAVLVGAWFSSLAKRPRGLPLLVSLNRRSL